MEASHPGYISYYPAQLMRELPLNPHRWVLPWSIALVLPVGGECEDAVSWFLESLPYYW